MAKRVSGNCQSVCKQTFRKQFKWPCLLRVPNSFTRRRCHVLLVLVLYLVVDHCVNFASVVVKVESKIVLRAHELKCFITLAKSESHERVMYIREVFKCVRRSFTRGEICDFVVLVIDFNSPFSISNITFRHNSHIHNFVVEIVSLINVFLVEAGVNVFHSMAG